MLFHFDMQPFTSDMYVIVAFQMSELQPLPWQM